MVKGIGVQTKDVVFDSNPLDGFMMIKKAGFDYCDFSLNGYFYNRDIYESAIEGKLLSSFFDQSLEELQKFFEPIKNAAVEACVTINQMHMPYPVFVPNADESINDYLRETVAKKSMEIAAILECPNIVVHGFKMASMYASEQEEWEATERFLEVLAPYAVDNGITICVENLYNSSAGKLVDGPCCDARLTADRIDAFNKKHDSEVLGFCFDVGHANLRNIDIEAFIVTMGSRLKVLHIHDNDGERDLHQVPYTFARTRDNKASTDWDGFIRGLSNIGFEGVLSFETSPVLTAFPDELREDALAFIAKIGKYFATRIK